MLATLVFLASSTAIPFGSPPAEASDPPAAGSHARLELAFEFAERPEGYVLNAIVLDERTGTRSKTAVGSCRTIDIDSFTDTDFGTPVICDGVTYTFDIADGTIVAGPIEGGQAVAVKHLLPGRVFVNGVPLLIEADRSKSDRP
ncbi:hypothetical protein U0C82_13275 [Fulvimarina sp. 2208YS6-2-32]|uniref:Uncharacterized protein n=1 Tax=Fulvimarina uroteuthidis TaxID=3098149 RepID=A0ABU5I4U1_9HYPH|nr:hypothetical protein [Fulvimarina sp. 2208YS6-2-32]MDY8110112.1 hypothetical protein [Fulvimarina sp. 2208YS6-2-32]